MGSMGSSKKEVVCAIDIQAPAEVVWRELVDFERFREWNPFIREAKGRASIGGQVRVRVRSSIPLPFPIIFHATVTTVEHARELRWLGHVLAPWLASGDHSFTLEPLGPARTRFTQREVFTGVMPHLLHRVLVPETRRGFEAMNLALKGRAESAPIASERAASALHPMTSS
jgi:hypothetical protein